MKIVLIYAAGWIGMAVLAILNGGIREKIYGHFMKWSKKRYASKWHRD